MDFGPNVGHLPNGPELEKLKMERDSPLPKLIKDGWRSDVAGGLFRLGSALGNHNSVKQEVDAIMQGLHRSKTITFVFKVCIWSSNAVNCRSLITIKSVLKP